MQGRPKDGPEDKFRLTPVVPRLEQLLGTTVRSSPFWFLVILCGCGSWVFQQVPSICCNMHRYST